MNSLLVLMVLSAGSSSVPLTINTVGVTEHSHLFASCFGTGGDAIGRVSKISCQFQVLIVMEPKPEAPEVLGACCGIALNT
jgi:hypothetical protein